MVLDFGPMMGTGALVSFLRKVQLLPENVSVAFSTPLRSFMPHAHVTQASQPMMRSSQDIDRTDVCREDPIGVPALMRTWVTGLL